MGSGSTVPGSTKSFLKLTNFSSLLQAQQYLANVKTDRVFAAYHFDYINVPKEEFAITILYNATMSTTDTSPQTATLPAATRNLMDAVQSSVIALKYSNNSTSSSLNSVDNDEKTILLHQQQREPSLVIKSAIPTLSTQQYGGSSIRAQMYLQNGPYMLALYVFSNIVFSIDTNC